MIYHQHRIGDSPNLVYSTGFVLGVRIAIGVRILDVTLQQPVCRKISYMPRSGQSGEIQWKRMKTIGRGCWPSSNTLMTCWCTRAHIHAKLGGNGYRLVSCIAFLFLKLGWTMAHRPLQLVNQVSRAGWVCTLPVEGEMLL